MIGFQEFKLFVFFERRFCVLNPKEDFCLEWKDKILGHEAKGRRVREDESLVLRVWDIDCRLRLSLETSYKVKNNVDSWGGSRI